MKMHLGGKSAARSLFFEISKSVSAKTETILKVEGRSNVIKVISNPKYLKAYAIQPVVILINGCL
jgi:hypothetical protein